MKFTKIVLIFTLLLTVSCSNKNKDENVVAETTDELAESGDEFIADGEGDELALDEEAPLEEVGVEAVASTEEEVTIEESGSTATYTVKNGETLMLVAFKLTGDYQNWKSIRDMNNLGSSELAEGQVIKYNAPATPFEWNPTGNPYLIKMGDTLGTISNEKYGTESKWKSIFDNNKPLIKDPNLIFAGFTIYYIPERVLASENEEEIVEEEL